MTNVTIVTGASGGLGRHISAILDRHGHRVVALDQVPEDDGLVCDVTSESSVAHAFDQVVERFGPPSGLVCAAGVVEESPVVDTDLVVWRRVVDVSLTGTFLTIRALLRSRGNLPAQSAVAFSSGYATKGYRHGASYAAAKAGVEALVKSLVLEEAPNGFRANSIAPGPIDTPMLNAAKAYPGRVDAVVRATPMGRLGQVDDIGEVVSFLLSDASRWITGQVLHVNGGMLMP